MPPLHEPDAQAASALHAAPAAAAVTSAAEGEAD